jgi:hypothetical protein
MLVIVLDGTLMCGGSHTCLVGKTRLRAWHGRYYLKTDRYRGLPMPLGFYLQGLIQPTNGPNLMDYSGRRGHLWWNSPRRVGATDGWIHLTT